MSTAGYSTRGSGGGGGSVTAGAGIDVTANVVSLKSGLKQDSTGLVPMLPQTSGVIPTPASGINVYADATGIFKWKDSTGLVKTVASISDIPGIVQPLGTIINETGASLAHFTTVNTSGNFTPSIVGGKIRLTNTSGTLQLGDYIRQSNYGNTNLDQWTYSADITVGTINSTSFGVWLGLQSMGDATHFLAYSIEVLINLDSTNKGKIGFYAQNTNTLLTNTGGATLSPALTVNASDVLKVTLRLIKNRITCTVVNTTTNPGRSVTSTLDFTALNPAPIASIPNVGQFTIGSAGGTHDVANINVYANQQKNIDYELVGDSIIEGLSLTNINNRAVDKIMRMSSLNIGVYARGGNKIEDVNTTELLSLVPAKIGLAIGTNNLGAGDSLATIQSKYTTLVNALVSAGSVLGTTLFIHLLIPRSDIDVSAVNAWLQSTYTTAVIDTYTPFVTTGFSLSSTWSPDALHPNEDGHQLYCDTLMNYKDTNGNYLFPIKTSFVSVKDTPAYFYNNKLGVGLNNQAPRYVIDGLGAASTAGAQFHLGTTTSDNGFYIFNNTATRTYISTGAVVNTSGNWIAKSTTSAVVDMNANSMVFSVDSGLTVGNNFTPTSVLTIAPGAVSIKTGTATAFLNILGGVVGRAQINLGSGVAPTTPNNGDVWFDGTNIKMQIGGVTKTFTLT